MRDYRSYLVTVAKRATPTVNKHLAALVDFYTWRGLGQPQGVKRHQVPRHAPEVLGPRAKLRYLRAVGACPSARDRAIALLPLYAGSRIAEIVALDVADVRAPRACARADVHAQSCARPWPSGSPSGRAIRTRTPRRSSCRGAAPG